MFFYEDGVHEFAFFFQYAENALMAWKLCYICTGPPTPLAVDPDVPVAVVVLRSYGNKRCQRAVRCISRA